MRQLGGGGKELAVGAGAEAAGAAGAVEAGVRDGAWREPAAGAGAGAGSGVRVGAEEAAGREACVEAGEELDLEPLLGASSDWPLQSQGLVSFYWGNILTHSLRTWESFCTLTHTFTTKGSSRNTRILSSDSSELHCWSFRFKHVDTSLEF